ncbi:MAG: DUF2264 domain-containing protein [Propionibacteriaceae bacterium]|nr:DUF2264 domain-containing protein [Propionibacteriaceae bacterium]
MDDTSTHSWPRQRWERYADTLLTAVRPYAAPGHGRIYIPGAVGGYGHDVDGLEGFARTFLLAGFRLAGLQGRDPLGLAAWYAQGVDDGVDPASPHRWVRPTEHSQAKVEAASIALSLDATRPWLWDRLDAPVQARVIDYLAEVVGDDTYPRNNWLWFRICVETFLRSVGGPWSPDDIAADLALHDSFVREDGWLADGDGRSFDHYSGWALQLYPTLWQRMAGARDLADDERRERDRALLDRYLLDAVHLVGADGGPLVQGRSLIYRFAAAAPFWVGALARVPSTSPGLLRHAASAIVGHFAEHGVPGERGLLTMGWFGPWRELAQSYSGPGSPYWAVKGLLGLALPPDDPAWTTPEEPLPVEQGDFVRTLRAPGWIVTGTHADGIVRVANHGTDHACVGDTVGDSPLYARFGYSTATAPLLDETAWTSPLDQSICLIDADGRCSHRAGFETLACRVLDDGAGLGVSLAHAHWLDAAPAQTRHGSGLAGTAEPAGDVLTVSVVRGPWEVRGVRVHEPAPRAVALRVGGWAVAGPSAPHSGLRALDGTPTTWDERPDASPLGTPARVPSVTLPILPDTWIWTILTLTSDDATDDATVTCADGEVRITWPDGHATRAALPRTEDGR